MAHMTSDGKRKSSKFRQARYDKENADKAPKMGGERAEANEMEDKTGAMKGMMGEEGAEEQIHPGIHDEVKQVMADHGPAHTVNMVHDHEGMKSHVHSIHADGHEHHGEHDGEEHVMNAHHHAAHAAGVQIPGEDEKEGDYPAEKETPTPDGEEDDHEVEPL